MPTTINDLARLVDGTVVGDGNIEITGAQPIDSAQSGSITFLASDKYLHLLKNCSASAIITSQKFAIDNFPLIQVADPLTEFIKIVQHFADSQARVLEGIDPRAAVHPSAKLGEHAYVAPFAVVGENSVIGDHCRIHSNVSVGRNCRIGDDVTLHPGVVLYDGTIIGNRVILHSNAVIGADGFGYRPKDGRHVKVPQLGNVRIEDDVEIGANTTIDRGTFGETCIGQGTKIDNLVQVAHNCQIGKHNLLVAQLGIAGSCNTGDYVTIGGQAGITDHVNIGQGAVIAAKAGITKDVPDGGRYAGAPAGPESEQKRLVISLFKVPEMRKDIKRIKQHLKLVDEAAA